MNAKHTPGPWEIRDVNVTFISIGAPEHHSLADTWAIDEGVTTEQLHANARLIAAAPELLEALEQISHAEAATYDDIHAAIQDLVGIARAVIAKATGA